MNQIRKQLTYANVMSSIAVFLVLGGAAVAATHLPANSVGTGQIRRNAVRVGKLAPEAVQAGKLAKNSVPTDRLRNGAVSTEKIAKLAVTNAQLADQSVTGSKIVKSTLGAVPEAEKLDGVGATAFGRQASSSTTNALVGVSGTARSLTVTAPQNGYLLAIASGSIYNDGTTKTFSICRINVDGQDLAASRRDTYTSEDVPRTVCGTNAVTPVSAGQHNVAFTFSVVPPEGGVDNAELDVVFIPLAG